MGRSRARLFILGFLHACVVVISLRHCDARKISSNKEVDRENPTITPRTKKTTTLKRFDMAMSFMDLVSSNTVQPNYGVSSPFSLPPYDSLAPIPLPDQNTPPYCENPPSSTTPTTIPSPTAATGGGGGYIPSLPPPSSSSSSPVFPIDNPPPSPFGAGGDTPPAPPSGFIPNPPIIIPTPSGAVPSPFEYIPSPTGPILSPPAYFEPTPPTSFPSPPSSGGGFGFSPSPPVFLPPIVYPPPSVPPPRSTGAPSTALWCVAKPSVPDPIIQEAMNYACGSGADCDQIQPSGSCFQPDNLWAHASYAFNSYWQRTKVAGGTCEFGGTAMLVSIDPSYDGCRFILF